MTRIQPAWLLAAALLAAFPARAQEKPKLLPDRDVDITYRVTDRSDAPVKQRVRWLAADHMQRIDGPGTTVILADRTTTYITILSPRTKSYLKVEEPPGGLFKSEYAGSFTRGGTSSVAHLACTEWTWNDASTQRPRTVCATDDGVMLRMIEGGRTLAEATVVTYRRVKPQTFQIPSGYEPTLVPDSSQE